MSEAPVPKIKKLPFLVGDLLLLGAAGAVVGLSPAPLGLWQAVVCTGTVAVGAWLGVLPFLEEYRGTLKLAESENLVDSLAQINRVEDVAAKIAGATGQWQAVHDHAGKAVQAGKDLFDRMQLETKEFRAFLEKANDVEKSRLRLEVEKLRRAEGDWLQILVRLLDNTFVLFQAAVRSKQPALIEQIGQFQAVSRDIARRVGLVPLTPKAGDPYDANLYELAQANGTPGPGALIGDVVATGYNFQGQLIRKPLVVVAPPSAMQDDPAAMEALAPPAEEDQASATPGPNAAELIVESESVATGAPSFADENPTNPANPPHESEVSDPATLSPVAETEETTLSEPGLAMSEPSPGEVNGTKEGEPSQPLLL